MEATGVVFLLLVLVCGVRVASVEPFRRDVGHPQWHHGTFEDVSSKVKEETHHLLHSRARVPFHVPQEVNIVLIGFNGDGGYRFNLDSEALQDFMHKTFPTHRPACLETGLPLDIEHDLEYTVIPVGQPELITLEWETRKNMVETGLARENEWGRELPLFEVEATALEETFDKMYGYLFNLDPNAHKDKSDLNEPVPNVIFITNFDKVRMDPRQEQNGTTLQQMMAAKIEDLPADKLSQQEGGYIYRYRYNGGAATQVWLGSGRYAVIDLSAGPCVYGKTESEEGSVGYRSIPRLQNLLFPRRRDPVKASVMENSFRGLLSALIITAIEHVIFPDVRYDYVDPAARLLVPIIVLSNHQKYNPLVPGSSFSIDMKVIENEVKRMAPLGQEVIVVGGFHNLHEHETLAVTVRKAIRSHSVHTTGRDGRFHSRSVSFLDAAILKNEMRHSTDVLAAGLLEAADPNLSARFFRKRHAAAWGVARSGTFPGDESIEEDSIIQAGPAMRGSGMLSKDGKGQGVSRKSKIPPAIEKSYGTRVLPVFVLSLEGVDSELLMEGEGLMMAHFDAVFVLQHNNSAIPLTFVADKSARIEQADSPLRHIVAGLASAVGGLAAPYERASHIHGRPMLNWLWASGHHPFGPFTNTSGISQLLVDASLRNAIYARVDTALRKIREANEKIQAFTSKYLHTPLGEKKKGVPKAAALELWLDFFYKKTAVLPLPVPQDAVDRLEKYLDGLEEQLVSLANLLYDHRLQDAFSNSSSVVRSAMFTNGYVDHMLWREKQNMRCCRVQYDAPAQKSNAFLYGGILVAGFLVYFLVIYFSAPER